MNGTDYPDLHDPRGMLFPWKLYGGIPTVRITPDDFLVAAVRNAKAGVALQLGGRSWKEDGQPSEISQPIIPGTARALQYFSIPLHHGFLSSATITATAGSPNRGQTLASLYLVRPPATAFFARQLLAQDYVTSQYGPTWPGGRHTLGVEGPGMLYSFSVTSPAAGADWTQTVPTGARWLLHGIYATLATSATAGSRNPLLLVDDGTNRLGAQDTALTQGVSLTNDWTWVPGTPTTGLFATPVNVVDLPFPMPMFAGWRIRTLTAALSATDQWSAIRLLVEEWLED